MSNNGIFGTHDFSTDPGRVSVFGERRGLRVRYTDDRHEDIALGQLECTALIPWGEALVVAMGMNPGRFGLAEVIGFSEWVLLDDGRWRCSELKLSVKPELLRWAAAAYAREIVSVRLARARESVSVPLTMAREVVRERVGDAIRVARGFLRARDPEPPAARARPGVVAERCDVVIVRRGSPYPLVGRAPKDRAWELVCYHCPLVQVPSPETFDHFFAADAAEMLAHLDDHRACGREIPESVYAALRRDHA